MTSRSAESTEEATRELHDETEVTMARRHSLACHCYNSARMNFPSRVRVFFIVRTVWGWSQKKLSVVSSQLSAKTKSLTVWFFVES